MFVLVVHVRSRSVVVVVVAVADRHAVVEHFRRLYVGQQRV